MSDGASGVAALSQNAPPYEPPESPAAAPGVRGVGLATGGAGVFVYVIHSDADDVVSYAAAKRHAEAVRAKGAKLEFKTLSGLSHFKTGSYGPHLRDAVTWLQAEWK